MVVSLNVLDYTCGECRRGGITSRAAAVRLAPRTIATLFMAKRRFNKYAHRQYLQSRARAAAADDDADADAADVTDADTADVPDADIADVTDADTADVPDADARDLDADAD